MNILDLPLDTLDVGKSTDGIVYKKGAELAPPFPPFPPKNPACAENYRPLRTPKHTLAARGAVAPSRGETR